jgi:hypothetical protein
VTGKLTARQYVVTPDVALYGGLSVALFPAEAQPLAVACANVLGRASFHGSELHVPVVFYSEITWLVSWAIAQNLIEFQEGQEALNQILGTTWEFHFPVAADVLGFYNVLGYPRTRHADYLAVAANLGCSILTADQQLIASSQAQGLSVDVVVITEHPWAKSGSLEDNPPA